MRQRYKTKLSQFLKWAEPACDIFGLLFISGIFISFLPPEILSPNPATGGDMGSHFWPLVALVKYGIPHWTLRLWNPGNLGGEPHLVHYFPMPFLLMAALSWILPLGTAFNIGTALPLLLLPLSVYFALRLLGLRFPVPLFGAASSMTFLYNESYSMWGGNTLSGMAGQFAHGYAFVFLFLGIGFLGREIRKSLLPVLSGLFFAAVNTSHAYVMLGLPFVFLSFIFAYDKKSLVQRLKICTVSGAFSLLLSAWFVVPMFDNAKWTTPFYVPWTSSTFRQEVFPGIFYPYAVILAVLLSVVSFSWFFGRHKLLFRQAVFWGIPTFGYSLYYFLFPKIGVIDVRAVPHIQIFLIILSAVLVGLIVGKHRLLSVLVSIPFLAVTAAWVDLHIEKFPSWVAWNYTGWVSKPPYDELMRLSAAIKGDFSMPRVNYEHNVINNSTGTERVFEMLPYFAGRATLESVYMQASVLAAEAFYLQARISKTPSCPFSQFKCIPYDLHGLEEKLRLMGVGEMILVTEELKEQAKSQTYLLKTGEFPPWTLYRLLEQPALVEVFKQAPVPIDDASWKKRLSSIEAVPASEEWDEKDFEQIFFRWFWVYSGAEAMIISNYGLDPQTRTLLQEAKDGAENAWNQKSGCRPTVEVDFSTLKLKTPCPGRAHFLKFAYHSSWKADTGDNLYMVSPGFIALVPSKEEVTLEFGKSPLWKTMNWISLLSLAGFFVFFLGASKLGWSWHI